MELGRRRQWWLSVTAGLACGLTTLFVGDLSFRKSFLLWVRRDRSPREVLKEDARYQRALPPMPSMASTPDVTAFLENLRLAEGGGGLGQLTEPELDDPARPTAVVARITGNNMPPLQGWDQVQRNVHFTLQWEATLSADGRPQRDGVELRAGRSKHKSSSTVRWLPRLWLVNRMLNETARTELHEVLAASGETVIHIPLDFEMAGETAHPELYVTNQGVARNTAVTESVALGAQWILPLDGNTYITDEGMMGIEGAILDAENMGAKYLLLPMYRLLRRPKQALDVEGEDPDAPVELPYVWAPAQRHNLTYSSKIGDMVDYILPMEAQLAVRHDAPFLFPEFKSYGDNNKFALLQKLHNFNRITHCTAADVGYDRENLPTSSILRTSKECGYVLRLPYWTEYPYPADDAAFTKARHFHRHAATLAVTHQLADRIGRGLPGQFVTDGVAMLIVVLGSASLAVVLVNWILHGNAGLARNGGQRTLKS